MEKGKNNDEQFDLKEEYQKLKEKFGLPDFESISKDFDIEKIGEKETNYLIREIRRVVVDKISAYLNLFENLVNPSGPPMFIFSALRSLQEQSKPKIKLIYKELSKIQIKSMKLDTIYIEEDEASFVKDTFDKWDKIKKDIYDIFDEFDKNFDKENGSKVRGYFD